MMKSIKEPIIFLGFGRSGTTIISEIIFQHPDLAWISNYQALFPDSKYINLVRHLFQNPLWNIQGQKKQLNKVSAFNKYIFKPTEAYSFLNKLTNVDFARGFLHNEVVDMENRERICNHFSAITKLQGKQRLSFKITGPSRIGYLKSIFPDPKFIWIKRQPLPNIRSLLKVGFYQNRKQSLWWNGEGIYSKQEIQWVNEWKNQPEFIAALQYFKINMIFKTEKKQCNQTELLEVNYEDFIANPKNEIDKILKFCNLGKSKSIIKYLDKNTIYNRNTTKDYFFTPELDKKIEKIATTGRL